MNRPAAGNPTGLDPPLETLAALALDCQTTGASAERDHVLEIGWARVGPTTGVMTEAACAWLTALPDGVALPPRVTRLTGVQAADLENALNPAAVWQRLLAAAADLPVPAHGAGGVLLIHYARFEVPFLEGLHVRCGYGGGLPFEIVCTHAIARRLLPHMPRCGLRALAGYFCVALGERKRAADHAAATRGVWDHLVPLLAAEGISRWSQLTAWLKSPAASAKVTRAYPMPRPLRRDTPDAPGVYRMRRSNGDLLYVGKARSLRRRINSYFQSRRRHPEHILEMLTQACDLDYTPTPTALEAALMEADLIKQADPPYNVALRPRESAPVCFAADFQTAGPPGRPGLPVGPLPSESALAAFRLVVAWCGRSGADLPRCEDALAAALGMPAACLPPRAILEEGLDRYRKICACPGDLTHTGRHLLRRGLGLWRKDRSEDRAARDDEEDVGGEGGACRDWDVPAVVAMLDGVVRRGSQLVRRGRWLQIVSNTSLAWETTRPGLQSERTLYIRQGRICRPSQGTSGAAAAIALPPAPSPAAARAVFTSAATYDRLRVLTTELRRLAAEGRRIRIQPAVGGSMGRRGLVRLLEFI
ncbi:MAG: GIY-YIG nuclease family protein [Desulfobacterales bacterium]|nr:GIY-YIG nuclease family protein [Desulfobacterales bacterium]